MSIPNRRALPTLFVSNDEYSILEEVAKEDGTTVVELLKTLISDCVEGEPNVVSVNVPHETWSAFAAFYDDEPVDVVMARYLESEGDVLRRVIEKVRAGTS
jgi:hypothetical protein